MAPEAEPGGAQDPAIRFIEVDGLRLRYYRSGTGPPVIIIHGAAGNLGDWTFGPALEIAQTHEVIAFDRPGLGLSGWPEDGEMIATQAALMRKASAKLGINRAIVIGHSYGGAVALAWAVDAPETVSGLLLLAAVSQVWPGGIGLVHELLDTPAVGNIVARALPLVVPEPFIEKRLSRVFHPHQPPPGYFEHLDPDLVLNPMSLLRNARQLSELKPQIAELVPRYPGLTMPMEIIHSADDVTVPMKVHSEPLSRQLPHARLTRLDGAGHMPHHTATADMLAALARLRAQL